MSTSAAQAYYRLRFITNLDRVAASDKRSEKFIGIFPGILGAMHFGKAIWMEDDEVMQITTDPFNFERLVIIRKETKA